MLRDRLVVTAASLTLWTVLSRPAAAHPASGIAVDHSGRVYFADTREGLWRVERGGRLTMVKGGGLHWMSMDRAGALAESPEQFGPFIRLTPRGQKPAVIGSFDSPCAAGKDGNVYYPKDNSLTIVRCSPRGEQSVLVSKEQFKRDGRHNMGVTGIACGSDGLLYVMGLDSFNRNEGVGEHVVWTVKADGTIGKFAEGFVKPAGRLPEAERPPQVRPEYCRGITVDGNGDVYVAVTGNRCVMKLTASGEATVVHRTTKPWTPTGVDVAAGELYVLEYDDETPAKHGDWPPRVAKVGRDGKPTTLATILRR